MSKTRKNMIDDTLAPRPPHMPVVAADGNVTMVWRPCGGAPVIFRSFDGRTTAQREADCARLRSIYYPYCGRVDPV